MGLRLLNPDWSESKLDAVKTILGPAWLAQIGPDQYEKTGLWQASKNGKLTALIEILAYEDEYEYLSAYPLVMAQYSFYYGLHLLAKLPVILVMLLGTECVFVDITKVQINKDTLVLADNADMHKTLTVLIPKSDLKYIGKIIPRADYDAAQ